MSSRDRVDADVAQGLQLTGRFESYEATQAAPCDILEEDPLDGILRAEAQDLVVGRIDDTRAHTGTLGRLSARPPVASHRLPAVPIHLRANTGDYAEACLLPGDPLRAKYIAETFLTDVVQVNAERGLLGFTGSWEGKPVSVQGTGMGCPSAAIVFEELIQLGVKRLLRVGTCGGLQPDHALGDLIVALSAVPADATATHLVLGEPHCPTASWELIHEAVHVAKTAKIPLRVGPVVSSDLFYNPDEGQYERWSKRGILGVEMESAALFTLGALRGVLAGCLLTVSDIVVEGEFVRISDEELRAAVDRMTRIALETATAEHRHDH
jgi:DeoD family purine-nucleoside phosphorylase